MTTSGETILLKKMLEKSRIFQQYENEILMAFAKGKKAPKLKVDNILI
jgi:hypothetical protein